MRRDGISVLAFGADPTGQRDSTAAVQAAIDAAAVAMPPGTLRIDGALKAGKRHGR